MRYMVTRTILPFNQYIYVLVYHLLMTSSKRRHPCICIALSGILCRVCFIWIVSSFIGWPSYAIFGNDSQSIIVHCRLLMALDLYTHHSDAVEHFYILASIPYFDFGNP